MHCGTPNQNFGWATLQRPMHLRYLRKTFRTEVLITAVFPSLPPTAYSAAFGAESHSAVEFDTIASIVTAQILITIVL